MTVAHISYNLTNFRVGTDPDLMDRTVGDANKPKNYQEADEHPKAATDYERKDMDENGYMKTKMKCVSLPCVAM